ncbi:MULTISPECIES: hypothetical protein [unclassified Cryobacterium]|uniref:hypothetical protein n=1 Tax=unclassified Cryobacterium TaxID=2649013 RepID=UPI002AB5228A|nr:MULTISPECIES: hypothetical protein [Cryobacterium]MDY7542140.1 hypothetical protein [Cryobacterium sp. 5B3]MEB0265856.1 hypothetical protein [Cryobacterium sp. 10I5]MEB0275943.1 hypothetical protein [Cryobacterium sp. 5B3]MEC5151677.1 hypothetical protein [Cryobacterium psychrotolerans]
MTATPAPPVSSTVMEQLRRTLPKHGFTGNASRISHSQVEFIGKLVDDSKVAEQIDAWRAADRVKTAPGGRQSVASTRTVLILFLLLSTERSALFVKEMATIASDRLSGKSLRHLDLWGKRESAKGWYFPLWRALHRALDAIDPKPGKQWKFSTPEQYEETLRHRIEANSEVKQARLDWVCNALIEATLQLVPEAARSQWQGDLCVDATVVPAYGKRGAPRSKTHVAIESDAGWYRRTSSHKETNDSTKSVKSVFGWDLTIAVQTNHDPKTLPGYPLLVAGIGFNIPGTALIRTARHIFESVAERGHPAGRATGDRGYFAFAKTEELHMPLRKLGYLVVTDYLDLQLGLKNGYAGSIQVEGALYCPSMPEGLINATLLYRAKEINAATWRKRIVERRQYMLRPKEKPDAKGRVPMMCPARGPGATVSCPLVENGCAKVDDALTTIYNPPVKPDTICTNATSVSVPFEVGAKLAQHYQYGSNEWQEIYSHDRNTIEGANGFLKDSSHEAIGDSSRRRVRGSTAQYLLVSILVVAGNLRKLQKFRDDMLRPETDDERADRKARKLLLRKRRKNRKDKRVAAWDDFQTSPAKT